MLESDVETFAAQPWVATSTDAGIALPSDGPEVHPRFYGSFPRKIHHYAGERGVISVEGAVRSATSLPAQIMGISGRGMIREGFAADIVIADLTRLTDRATFQQPHQYSDGIQSVLINGSFVIDDGKPTGTLPGRLIKRSGGRRESPQAGPAHRP